MLQTPGTLRCHEATASGAFDFNSKPWSSRAFSSATSSSST